MLGSAILMMAVYFYSGIMENVVLGVSLMAIGAAAFLLGASNEVVGNQYTGILRDGFLEDVQGFNDMVNVNLVGAFNVLHAVVPHMKNQKQGYIFNLASLCGKVGYAGIGAYTASKFALVGLNESLFNDMWRTTLMS